MVLLLGGSDKLDLCQASNLIFWHSCSQRKYRFGTQSFRNPASRHWRLVSKTTSLGNSFVTKPIGGFVSGIVWVKHKRTGNSAGWSNPRLLARSGQYIES